LSLADAIFLEASVSEVSKKIVSAIGKQEKEFLCQQFAAIQRKVSALQIGVSNPNAYYPANNSTARKLDNNDQREADDFAKLIWRQGEEIGHRVMERIPQGKWCRSYVCPFILSIDNSTHIYYAARPNSSRSSFPTPSVIWLLTTARTQLDIDQKIKKWPIEYLAVVRMKERNADKETAATTVAREETVQQAETAALSMQVNPQAPPSSDVLVPLMIPSLFAPLPKPRSSSTKGLFVGPPCKNLSVKV